MSWFVLKLEKKKDFNVAFETDNISSVELLLRHNKYPEQILTCLLLYLPGTTI